MTTDIHSKGRMPAGRAAMARKSGWLNGLWRMIRYRLHIPMKRSQQPANHIARGVMVGTVWACTPLFGLHMLGSFLTWLASNRLFRWNFSLVNALAWTWITNVFTVVPCYYLFYLTGQLMLGRLSRGHEAGQGFSAITAQIDAADNLAFSDIVVNWFNSLLSNVGAPLAVGWIPWSILFGWIAYRLSLSFVTSHRRHSARRREGKRKRETAAGQQAG